MSFVGNATPLLMEIVKGVAPAAIAAECPCEVISERKAATIRLRVARSVFGREFRDNRALDAFIDAGDHAETSLKRCRLSQELLPLDGIGRDSFFLNEYYSDEGPKLSGFATLRAWDEYTHDTQEAFALDEGRREGGTKPYVGRLLWDWARWLEGGRLVYGNLSVATSYLGASLADHAADLARSRYETEWVNGPEHGSRTESGHYRWNMIEQPASLGTLRFAVEHLACRVVNAWEEGPLAEQIAASGVWVVRKRREEDGEINEDIVFSGIEAMDRARFRNWLGDLSALPDGAALYGDIEARAKAKIGDFMNAAFSAIERAAEDFPDLSMDHWREISRRAALELASYPGLEEEAVSGA